MQIVLYGRSGGAKPPNKPLQRTVRFAARRLNGNSVRRDRPMTRKSEIHEKTLGSEWDRGLFEKLVAAVNTLGGKIVESSYGVGGSQEVTEYSITLPDADLRATSETHAGLMLRGPRTAVERLATLIDEQGNDV